MSSVNSFDLADDIASHVVEGQAGNPVGKVLRVLRLGAEGGMQTLEDVNRGARTIGRLRSKFAPRRGSGFSAGAAGLSGKFSSAASLLSGSTIPGTTGLLQGIGFGGAALQAPTVARELISGGRVYSKLRGMGKGKFGALAGFAGVPLALMNAATPLAPALSRSLAGD